VVVWRVPKSSDAAEGEFDAAPANKRVQRVRKGSRKVSYCVVVVVDVFDTPLLFFFR
jgi:hypothetical protein